MFMAKQVPILVTACLYLVRATSRKPASRIKITSSLINKNRSYSQFSPNHEFSHYGACQFPARLACICIAEVGLFGI